MPASIPDGSSWERLGEESLCFSCGRAQFFDEYARTGILQSRTLMDANAIAADGNPPNDTIRDLVDWSERLQVYAKRFERLWARAGHAWNRQNSSGIFGAETWQVDAETKILVGGTAGRVLIQIERDGEYVSFITSDSSYGKNSDRYANGRPLIDKRYGYSRMGCQGVYGRADSISSLCEVLLTVWPESDAELDALMVVAG